MSRYQVEVGLVKQTATTTVEAASEAEAREKAKRRIGDTTRFTVVMQVIPR